MEPKAIFRVDLDLRQQRQIDRFAVLRPGDRIHARVVRLEADGRALIDLGGYRALADSVTDLAEVLVLVYQMNEHQKRQTS